jgi:DnaJ family protein C protein 8
MAASGTTSSTPAALDAFLAEVKAIQKRDSVLTSSQQIERLLRPGSMYFNLNPFEVRCKLGPFAINKFVDTALQW